MENATKALLIAAAVLVAIIIISITLVIVNQGQEAVSGADLSEIEAAQFNASFLSYQGTNVSTAQVNALLNTVFRHNKNELASGENRYVAITVTGKNGGAAIQTLATLATSNVSSTNTIPRVTGSYYYTVTCSYTGTRITSITATQK